MSSPALSKLPPSLWVGGRLWPLLLLLLPLACSPGSDGGGRVTGSVAASEDLIFVRGGVVVPVEIGTSAATDVQLLPGGRSLVKTAWTAGQSLTVAGHRGVAPAQAECLPVFSVDLGDVSRLVAMGGAAPDTALAFSPDGKRLAIGSYLGQVLVVDGWTGQTLARRDLPEALVRDVAWSTDGATLYVAEQSPDAMLWALDSSSLEPRWSLRLADIVGSSTPPAGQDLYGVYSLPAGFGLAVLQGAGQGGDLIVAAGHGWGEADGSRRNQGQVLRITAGGKIAARWPAQPAELTLMHPVLDPDGQRLVVAVAHSSSLPAPPDLPVGGVQVLDLPDLTPAAAVRPTPLGPYFHEVRVWQALDVSGADDTVLMGLNDGRVQLRSLDGSLRSQVDGGAPILAGDVPLHAGVGWAALSGGHAFYATSSTRIPWGSAAPDLRPPSAHPAENTLTSLRLDGSVDWSWKGEQELQGLSLSADGDELLLGAGARVGDTRRDLYGGLVFDIEGTALSGKDRSGSQRLAAVCNTEGPVFFVSALSADGRAALTEFPYADDQGAQHGAYRVTVMR